MGRKIHRVGGPDISEAKDCCVYLVNGSRPFLVDAGFGEGSDKVISNIEKVGVDPQSIDAVILTHCHIDHIGGAGGLRDILGARLYMHELDAAIVERGDSRLTAAFCFEREFVPLPIDVKISGSHGPLSEIGEDIFFVHTPGHTPGSISPFLDSEGTRILFGQDLGAPLLSEFDTDPGAWYLSMEKLLDLKADVLCDGHSGFYQPASRVEAYIRRFVRLYSRRSFGTTA